MYLAARFNHQAQHFVYNTISTIKQLPGWIASYLNPRQWNGKRG